MRPLRSQPGAQPGRPQARLRLQREGRRQNLIISSCGERISTQPSWWPAAGRRSRGPPQARSRARSGRAGRAARLAARGRGLRADVSARRPTPQLKELGREHPLARDNESMVAADAARMASECPGHRQRADCRSAWATHGRRRHPLRIPRRGVPSRRLGSRSVPVRKGALGAVVGSGEPREVAAAAPPRGVLAFSRRCRSTSSSDRGTSSARLAHLIMLARQGIVPRAKAAQIRDELVAILTAAPAAAGRRIRSMALETLAGAGLARPRHAATRRGPATIRSRSILRLHVREQGRAGAGGISRSVKRWQRAPPRARDAAARYTHRQRASR